MADSVEIHFVDESEFQNDGKWYSYIDNSQLEIGSTLCGRLGKRISISV